MYYTCENINFTSKKLQYFLFSIKKIWFIIKNKYLNLQNQWGFRDVQIYINFCLLIIIRWDNILIKFSLSSHYVK